jgi:hypothetical protein
MYQPPRTPATTLASGLSHYYPLPFPNDEHQQLFKCNLSDLSSRTSDSGKPAGSPVAHAWFRQ